MSGTSVGDVGWQTLTLLNWPQTVHITNPNVSSNNSGALPKSASFRDELLVSVTTRSDGDWTWLCLLVKVIKWFLSVLRTEVSRHFKVIRVLGFWDVPTRMSQRWVTKKEWWATSNIALGHMQTMHRYKWWTKNISTCRWISVYRLILHSAPGTCKAGS
jgi:hypothetical protein